MRLYSVDFHANNEGTYEICIYQGTSTSSWGHTIPTTQIASQTITVTNTGWNTVDFTSSVIIDGGQDLWVFVHNPEPIVGLSSYFCTAENDEGCYYTPDIIHYTQNTFTNLAFLIKTYVTDGTIQRGCKVRITREGKQIFEGNLASLKRFKDDVKEVREGFECGLVFEKFSDIAEGDIVEAYIMQEVPR